MLKNYNVINLELVMKCKRADLQFENNPQMLH